MSYLAYSAMPYDKGQSGISSYIRNTLKELGQREYLCIFVLKQDLAELKKYAPGSHKWVVVSNFWAKPILNMFWHLFIFPFLLLLQPIKGVFLPAANRRLNAFYSFPTVATVHDLSPFHIPQKYDALRMNYVKHVIPAFLKQCPQIVAISESTKKDLLRFYKLKAQDIQVCYNGFNPQKTCDAVGENIKLREKLGLPRPFILYIARIEHPGKNHINLIKAYQRLPQALKEQYDLVFAGSDWNGAEVVHQYVKDHGLTHQVRFLGFVPDEQIPELYNLSSLYAFPSFYEGFGLPLIEAMDSGTAVVCSNNSSLGEVAADAALTFDPASPEDMAQVIERVLTQPELKLELIQKGLVRAKSFSWSKHVDDILDLFKAQAIQIRPLYKENLS